MSNPLHENPPASFLQKLEEESLTWEKDGLISSGLRETILRRYENVSEPVKTPQGLSPKTGPGRETAAVREFPLYIRVILVLAVLLVGLAAFLLISFNWAAMSGAVKLSIVGGVLAASHFGGLWLRKTGWRNWADGVFFFAGIMYGVGIWQVGQVFHLPADFPTGFWLWGVGVMLMALVLGSTVLHFLAVVLIGGWIVAAMTGSMNLDQMFWHGLMPFSAPTLPVMAAAGIGIGLLRQERISPTLYSLLILFWWVMQGVGCGLGPYLTFHIAAAGLICIAVSACFRSGNMAHQAMGRLGILLLLGSLILPSFLFYWGELLYRNHWPHWNRDSGGGQTMIFFLWSFLPPVLDLMILLGLFLLNSRKRRFFERIRSNALPVGFSVTLFVLWFGGRLLSLYLDPGVRSHVSTAQLRLDMPALGGMLSVNALIVIMTVWLIYTGLKRNRGDGFWSGVLFFLLWAVIRYIDLFSDIGGMLGAAAIFLFCGLVMLGIVYVWARRNRGHGSHERNAAESEPDETPAVDRLEPMRRKVSFLWQSERNVLAGGALVALLQFGILGAMIANEIRPHLSGTTIQVTTVPVDPRDLFRGDYVILRYGFSNIGNTGTIPHDAAVTGNGREQTVFVTMRQDGDIWKPVYISVKRPKDGVFLRGVRKRHSCEIVYGIESYFVQEGMGKTIENAIRTNRVVVELNVAPDGKASIKTLHIR
ncbi:MAG: GDYXXLXY domain-containing protein [Planctomycetaceae bacterium]|jgi:uncharacterized membrane-anchored protein/uncharacterized membrane protein|nr:GDYXXLXY domain-containing protein [Planctomycetaceae bacterium]